LTCANLQDKRREIETYSAGGVKGFSLSDCTPVSNWMSTGGNGNGNGNENENENENPYQAKVVWKGGSVLPSATPGKSKTIKLRFVLLRARLYSFDFV
jgi:hypothetical protein